MKSEDKIPVIVWFPKPMYEHKKNKICVAKGFRAFRVASYRYLTVSILYICYIHNLATAKKIRGRIICHLPNWISDKFAKLRWYPPRPDADGAYYYKVQYTRKWWHLGVSQESHSCYIANYAD